MVQNKIPREIQTQTNRANRESRRTRRIIRGGVSRELQDFLLRRQVFLEGLKISLANDYVRQASEFFSDDIVEYLRSELTEATTRRERNKVIAEINRRQRESYVEINEQFNQSLIDLSVEEEQYLFRTLGTVLVSADLVNFAQNSYSRARNQPIQATGELLEPFIRDMSSRNIARVNRAIKTGIAQGQTTEEIIRRINGTRARNFRDGVLRRNWNDARSVVSTAVQHVSTEARMETYTSNMDILDRYQWISTLDGSTSSQCRSLDQQTFMINQGPLPPIHIRCRSTTVPYFGEDTELYDYGATRSAQFGPVPAGESYYNWLKQQPASFQDAAIGRTRGRLLRDGGLTSTEFSQLQLDRNFRPITLEQMRQLNPAAFERANI